MNLNRAPQPLGYVPPKLESPRTPAPIIRAQSDDSPPAIRIPTPEELGVGRAPIVRGDEPLDWSMVERRLDSAGVTGYQMDKTATGFMFTCKTAAGNVAGQGASRNEAVRQALARLNK